MTRPEGMRLAREMYGQWSGEQIRRYLAEHGLEVGRSTIQEWADPDYAARRRVQRAEYKRAQKLMSRMARLKNRGLSYRTISEVLDEYHGVELDREQVRHALDTGRPTRAVKKAVRP